MPRRDRVGPPSPLHVREAVAEWIASWFRTGTSSGDALAAKAAGILGSANSHSQETREKSATIQISGNANLDYARGCDHDEREQVLSSCIDCDVREALHG